MSIIKSFLFLLLIGFNLLANAQNNLSSESYTEAYYLLDHLNSGLTTSQPAINLQTPQAALEHFILSCRKENYATAAQALNLNLIPEDQQQQRAAELAERFFYVINQRLWINWDNIPDRPDGQIDGPGGGGNPLIGVPRRSLKLGSIDVNGRDIAIRLQRIKLKQRAPVWVFAANTVENIDLLYEKFGPGLLQKHLPDWATQRIIGNIPLWQWLALFIFLAVAILSGWLLQKYTARLLQRADLELPLLPELINTLRLPVSVVGGLLVFYLANLSLLTLTGPIAKILNPLLAILIIAALTWLGMRVIGFFSDYFSQKYQNELENFANAEVRHTLTTIAVARRVLIFIAILVGITITLSQLNLLESLGLSLLASAGVVSVIVGIAAQGVLSNIMAGIQIAITRPASIGDNVYFEDQWGYVEEITYTYLVIRTWDQRRVVVPLKYFLSKPFENWSMNDSHLIKPIHFYLDYRTDLEKIRDKFEQLLKQSDDWDEVNPPSVQVTALNEETMEVRALCSAKNPSIAWDLHCHLREQMIDYIQNLEDGKYLPVQRLALEDKNKADDQS